MHYETKSSGFRYGPNLQITIPARGSSEMPHQRPDRRPHSITRSNGSKELLHRGRQPQKGLVLGLRMVCGGQTGIRTLETVSRLHTFQACAFDHSATCPWAGFSAGLVRLARPEIYVFACRCHSLAFGPYSGKFKAKDQVHEQTRPPRSIDCNAD